MISQPELEIVARRTVLLYNRLKSPEAFAKVIRVTPEIITISFSGSFCYSCGVMNFVEDFVRDFKVLTNKATIVPGKTRETSPRTFEADYLVRAL